MANSNEGNTTGHQPGLGGGGRYRNNRLAQFRAVHRLTIATALLGLALAVPSAYADNCGGVKTAHPRRHAVPGRPPLIVGDSVLLGAVDEVARVGYEVNTRGCRQMREGLRVIAAKRRAGRLPPLVVIMLGANGRIEPAQIRTALRIIGPGRVLGLVTPRKNPGVSRVFHAAARRHSSRVAVLDWRASTARHPGWFAPDGNHMGPGGAQALARFLRRALRYAIPLDGRWERLPSAASGADASSSAG